MRNELNLFYLSYLKREQNNRNEPEETVDSTENSKAMNQDFQSSTIHSELTTDLNSYGLNQLLKDKVKLKFLIV